MILLDTNVVSEPLRPMPDLHVVGWIDAQSIETLYLSAITIAELRFGITVLPDGRRKEMLRTRLEDEVLPLFAERTLPFDLSASQAFADPMAKARVAGKAIGKADRYIAAVAACRGFSVATRDRGPFEAAGVTVIDPWESVAS
jgi:hypothetical protein